MRLFVIAFALPLLIHAQEFRATLSGRNHRLRRVPESSAPMTQSFTGTRYRSSDYDQVGR